MRAADYIKSAWGNLKGRKKTGKTMKYLLFTALLIYFIVNSLSSSAKSFTEQISKVPLARTLTVDDDENDSVYNRILADSREDDRLESVYHYITPLVVHAKETQAGKETVLELKACTDAMKNYLYTGTMPEEGEILLPQYLYGTDEEGGTTSELVGKKITITVTDWNEKQTELEYLVCGTYDNIMAVTGNTTAYLVENEAVQAYEISMEGIRDLMLRQMKESGNYNRETYIGYEVQHIVGVQVKDYKDMDAIKEKYSDLHLSPVMLLEENSIEQIAGMVQFVGNLIAVFLLVIALINTMIVVLNDVSGRKKEMALYLTQGYTEGQVTGIILLEYVARMLWAFLMAAIIAFAILTAADLAVEKIFGIEYGILHLGFEPVLLPGALAIIIIIMLAVVYQIVKQIRKIIPARELKSEG